MKKTYKIDVDCANCANKMEEATKNTKGVKDATVNFMALKMKVKEAKNDEKTKKSFAEGDYRRCVHDRARAAAP